MTPELKIACEVVFQEHKTSSQPVKWTNDAFRGRISIGLSEMAKMTLVGKNIIIVPDKSKKIATLLNPAVATAASFEEAEEMIENNTSAVITSMGADQSTYIADKASVFVNYPSKDANPLLSIAGRSETPVAVIKWYLKPLFYYFIWPVCGAAAGAFIAHLIGLVYTELFLNVSPGLYP